jgi:three-Cys-motif partner protein
MGRFSLAFGWFVQAGHCDRGAGEKARDVGSGGLKSWAGLVKISVSSEFKNDTGDGSMSRRRGVGCSEHSRFKQEMLRQFMIEHISICRSIGARWPIWEYLFLDLFSGPGFLPDYPDVDGSPLIALKLMDGSLPYRALFFDEDPEVVKQLQSRIRSFENATVLNGRCQDSVFDLIGNLITEIMRCGLIYVDPNKIVPNDLSPIDLLVKLANHPVTKYCDILLHLPATSYKRVRALLKYKDSPTLMNDLGRLGKTCVKISETDGRQQWVFILLTNFEKATFGRSIGCFDAKSGYGRVLFNKVTMTIKERMDVNDTGYLTFMR